VRRDVKSGKGTENRPGFQELVRDIKQRSIDVLIVYGFGGFSRNVGDIYDFIDLTKERGVCSHSQRTSIRLHQWAGRCSESWQRLRS